MIDQFKILMEQPSLLFMIVPAIAIVIYIVILILGQVIRLFTNKPPYK